MKALRCAYLLLAATPLLVAVAAAPRRDADAWTPTELDVISSMRLDRLGPVPSDPSNRFDGHPGAIELGRKLFFDPRLSRNGAVSCASCHNPDRGFQDDRAVGQGVGVGRRRSMPIVDAVYSPWVFWDGRKDSLWSQALGPLEDAAEHGGTRTAFVRQLAVNYPTAYREVFGPLPDVAHLRADASPLGTPEQRATWAALDTRAQADINRAFSNMGKSIAAFERTLRHVPARFDRYAIALEKGDPAAVGILTASEVAGLKIFIGKGQCVSCHAGPLLTDLSFHNTGVPPVKEQPVDRGRGAVLSKIRGDDFNCLGPYSDARAEECGELNFMADRDPAMEGAFKTPGLRGIADRPPYMHAGQFASLERVIRHYIDAPKAAIGHNELAEKHGSHGRDPTRLTEDDVRHLVAFLGTLSPD